MSMSISDVLRQAIEQGASDVFIISNRPITLRIEGQFHDIGVDSLMSADTEAIVKEIYTHAATRDISALNVDGEDDFSFSIGGLGRFRVNAFMQRNSMAAVIRVLKFDLPDPTTLDIPDTVLNLAGLSKGLVLVTGAAGSGKSTTLSCIIDRINSEKSGHIIMMEDPIEFIHRHKKCIVTQREVNSDTRSYAAALRAALRQSPDVLLLGEMRDLETIEIAMTAAETGQLIFSTLHSMSAAKSIDRIVDVFPPNQQQQIRVQLSMVLKAVVSQQLLPSTAGKRVPAFEIMLSNLAIQNMIREGKIPQIENAIAAGANTGMTTMDGSLVRLYENGVISKLDAITHANNRESVQERLDGSAPL